MSNNTTMRQPNNYNSIKKHVYQSWKKLPAGTYSLYYIAGFGMEELEQLKNFARANDFRIRIIGKWLYINDLDFFVTVLEKFPGLKLKLIPAAVINSVNIILPDAAFIARFNKTTTQVIALKIKNYIKFTHTKINNIIIRITRLIKNYKFKKQQQKNANN